MRKRPPVHRLELRVVEIAGRRSRFWRPRSSSVAS